VTEPLHASDDLPNGWTFEEPARRVDGNPAHDYSALMAHPGRWVLIRPRARSANYGSSTARAAAKNHGGAWNGVSRRNKALSEGKPTWRSYLCYIGPEAAS